jgi:hypothetical protein
VGLTEDAFAIVTSKVKLRQKIEEIYKISAIIICDITKNAVYSST